MKFNNIVAESFQNVSINGVLYSLNIDEKKIYTKIKESEDGKIFKDDLSEYDQRIANNLVTRGLLKRRKNPQHKIYFMTKGRRKLAIQKPLEEVAPPDSGIEKWIEDNEERFKERYGKEYKKYLYGKAWNKFNGKPLNEGWHYKISVDDISYDLPSSDYFQLDFNDYDNESDIDIGEAVREELYDRSQGPIYDYNWEIDEKWSDEDEDEDEEEEVWDGEDEDIQQSQINETENDTGKPQFIKDMERLVTNVGDYWKNIYNRDEYEVIEIHYNIGTYGGYSIKQPVYVLRSIKNPTETPLECIEYVLHRDYIPVAHEEWDGEDDEELNEVLKIAGVQLNESEKSKTLAKDLYEVVIDSKEFLDEWKENKGTEEGFEEALKDMCEEWAGDILDGNFTIDRCYQDVTWLRLGRLIINMDDIYQDWSAFINEDSMSDNYIKEPVWDGEDEELTESVSLNKVSGYDYNWFLDYVPDTMGFFDLYQDLYGYSDKNNRKKSLSEYLKQNDLNGYIVDESKKVRGNSYLNLPSGLIIDFSKFLNDFKNNISEKEWDGEDEELTESFEDTNYDEKTKYKIGDRFKIKPLEQNNPFKELSYEWEIDGVRYYSLNDYAYRLHGVGSNDTNRYILVSNKDIENYFYKIEEWDGEDEELLETDSAIENVKQYYSLDANDFKYLVEKIPDTFGMIDRLSMRYGIQWSEEVQDFVETYLTRNRQILGNFIETRREYDTDTSYFHLPSDKWFNYSKFLKYFDNKTLVNPEEEWDGEDEDKDEELKENYEPLENYPERVKKETEEVSKVGDEWHNIYNDMDYRVKSIQYQECVFRDDENEFHKYLAPMYVLENITDDLDDNQRFNQRLVSGEILKRDYRLNKTEDDWDGEDELDEAVFGHNASKYNVGDTFEPKDKIGNNENPYKNEGNLFEIEEVIDHRGLYDYVLKVANSDSEDRWLFGESQLDYFFDNADEKAWDGEDESEELMETKPERLKHHTLEPDAQFAHISAERNNPLYEPVKGETPKIGKYKRKKKQAQNEENNKKTKQLKKDIKDMGLSYIKTYGAWHENDKTTKEKSFIIPNISKEDAMKLGKKYKQYSIIFKSSGEGTGSMYITLDDDRYGLEDMKFIFNKEDGLKDVDTSIPLTNYSGYSGLKKNGHGYSFKYKEPKKDED